MGRARGAAAIAALMTLSLLVPAAQASLRPTGHRIAHLRTTGGQPPPTRRQPLPLLFRNPRALRRAKAAANARGNRGVVRTPRAVDHLSPDLAVFGGLNASGMAAGDALFGDPPDTTGSIGPNGYVEEVNDGIAVFDRSDLARIAGPMPNEEFMHSPFLTFVSDPQMQWDQRAGRWLYLALSFSIDFSDLQPTGPTYLLFGFSRTGDATDLSGGWCHYSLASGYAPDGRPLLDDYPKLGHDDRHLVFGDNVYALAGANQTFVTARIWSVPMPPSGPLVSCPSALAAASFGSPQQPLRTPAGALAFTPVPANTIGPSGVDYVVAADDPTLGPRNHITAWHVAGSATRPLLVPDGAITVPSYGVPRPARDFIFPGIDTLDGRLTMAVGERDPADGLPAVWTQHTADPGDGSVVMRWYELLPSRGHARQVGTISEPGLDVFNGSVSPSANGRAAVLDYNRSGFFLYPDLRVRAHTGVMPAGATSPAITLATSPAPDLDLSCTPVCRWGDYSGASPDPVSRSLVWVAGQTLAPGFLLPQWRTHIAALAAVPTSLAAPEVAHRSAP